MDSASLPTKNKVEKPSSEDKVDEADEQVDTRTEQQKRRDADDSLSNPKKSTSEPKVETGNQSTDDPEPEEKDTEEDESTDDDGNMPGEDNTPNQIEIDEDLTLIIRGQGLGRRKVLDQPNILILSDEDGTVSIDICVNKRGKVESAEFNSKLSTIAKKSLVSLAIRKSKDFWFEKKS